MATKYAESLIAVKYRVKTGDGRIQGGAMYVLERELHMRWLAAAFALFGTLASFGIGCAVQSNAIGRRSYGKSEHFSDSYRHFCVGVISDGYFRRYSEDCGNLHDAGAFHERFLSDGLSDYFSDE